MRPSRFVAHAKQYLALRRSLGFALVTVGRLLLDFARFADKTAGTGPLTLDLAVRWAESSERPCSSNAARRLTIVRGFAKYCAGFESATQIPPIRLFGPRARRSPPHIYSDAEMADLLGAAAHLRPRNGLRPYTYVTLFSLLASTGLRVSEARRLSCSDVDLERGLLTVRESKFRKSRLVPLHPSAIEPLRRYVARRNRSRTARRSDFFFLTDSAPYLTLNAVEMEFWRMRKILGWTANGRTRLPRIHDIRHTFATVRLLRWHEQGADIERKLSALATYLGHVQVTQTYWYLTAVPELMALTARRFERFARPGQESVT
jgi:integrase